MSKLLTAKEALTAELFERLRDANLATSSPDSLARMLTFWLLTSGVVRDVVTLADDEALVASVNTMGATEHVRLFAGDQPHEIVSVLRGLALAMSPQAEVKQ